MLLRLLPDKRLARRAANGDRRAAEAVYRRHERDLHRFCLAMTGNRREARAATDATMAGILQGLGDNAWRAELRPWLYRIARRETSAVLRRRGEAERRPVGIAAGDDEKRMKRLLADLELLPQRQRALLVMRELSGLDFDEIGAAFGVSTAVARASIFEARITLRQLHEGRQLRCAKVMWELSESDGRARRRLRIRSHLRSCPECRAFGEEIEARRGNLAAIAPLPALLSAKLLSGVLGHSTAHGIGASGGSGIAGGLAAGAGGTVGATATIKATAAAAVVAVTGLSAADPGKKPTPAPQAVEVGAAPSGGDGRENGRPGPGSAVVAVADRRGAAAVRALSVSDRAVPSPSEPVATRRPVDPSKARSDEPESPGGGALATSELAGVDAVELASAPSRDLGAASPDVTPATETAGGSAGEAAPVAGYEMLSEEPPEPAEAAPEAPSPEAEPAEEPPPAEIEPPSSHPSPPAFGRSARKPGEWHSRRRPRYGR